MAPEQSNPFIKQLASSDRRIRERALSALRTYLQQTPSLDLTSALKLHKGLYYCMWLSDKPRPQQQLARDLADLLHVLKPDSFLVFARAFWQTMSREWNEIDRWRMDKYLYLVRLYVQEGFVYLRQKKWEEGLVEGYVGIMEEVGLNVRDGKVPNGLRYHVVDIYVDELDEADEKDDAPLEVLLAPLRRLGKESPVKSLRERVQEGLDNPRLEDWAGRRELGAESEEDDDQEDGADVQSAGTLAHVGADSDDDFGGFED
ncbi:hypothetical protein B0A48_08074 [Cryoendolithus antarcticus]|uniref:Ribosomal RNA-processing protein 1 n=1 Tax=Cryoendolithus antarcticus TaxID=1507870 RepID=A0A1V8T148_9PEZI|nr:hypothetical protein B0A48_08074 [Cryoendolithus antarcticus]